MNVVSMENEFEAKRSGRKEGEREKEKTKQESEDGRKVDERWRIDSPLHLGSNCLAPPGSVQRIH